MDPAVRELAVCKLEEIEAALKGANDVEAMAVIRHAIKELKGDLNLKDRSEALGRIAGGGLQVAAAAVGSSLQTTSEAAKTAVRSSGTRAVEAAIAAKEIALEKGGDVARSTASGVKAGVAVASEVAGTAVRSGAAGAAKATIAAKEVALDKGGDFMRSTASGAASGFVVAYQALMGYAENLDWNSIDPSRYLQVGTRGVERNLAEARLVWESIPEHLRALGPEEVAKRLDGFDWSHIRPFSEGGSNAASNGIFELAALNRSRGAARMTPTEVEAAQQALTDQAFKAALFETASQAFRGAVVGAAVGCVLACLEHGLEYQRREISRDQMYQRVGLAVAKSAIVGAAVSGLMTIVALTFPAIIPLATFLMLPLAVLGFCVVGGKVVLLGKGWYELLQDRCARQFPEVFPIAALPAAEALASE